MVTKKENKNINIAKENDLIEIKSLFDFDNKNIAHFTNKFLYSWNRKYNLIVNMELLNGEFKTFYVKAVYKGFVFNKKRYIIDTTFKYYSQTFKNYCLDYNEEFCLPIKKEINIKEIRNQLEEENEGIKNIEVKNMINPYILEQFVKSNLAEGILKGKQNYAVY